MRKGILLLILSAFIGLVGCGKQKGPKDTLVFSTSAEYPPFEYMMGEQLVGFDIELANLISSELGLKAKFVNLQFSTVLLALQNGKADAAIATITVTSDRLKNFDFSNDYYTESLAMISSSTQKIDANTSLAGKRIGCQLGTTMEYWLKDHAKEVQIITYDSNPQAIEALKAGHVDGVLIDFVQATAFASKNTNLVYNVIAKADSGYAIAFKKGSPLLKEFNEALKSLDSKGELDKLKKKYLEA